MKFAVLASGSSGNSVYLEIAGKHFLVDAGVSNRAICKQLESIGVDNKQLDSVFITHEHIDHIRGIDVLARSHPKVKVYANKATWRAGNKFLHRVINEQRQFTTTHSQFTLDDVTITPFAISHDAVDPVGYKFEAEGKSIVVATDLGIVSQGVHDHLLGTDAIVIESNHDPEMLQKGPYPYFLKQRIAGKRGHLANNITAELLKRVIARQTQAIVLAHLSDKNNTPEIALKVNERILCDAGLRPNKDFVLKVANRNVATPMITIC